MGMKQEAALHEEYRMIMFQKFAGEIHSWLDLMHLRILPGTWAKWLGVSRQTIWRVNQEPENYYIKFGEHDVGDMELLRVIADGAKDDTE